LPLKVVFTAGARDLRAVPDLLGNVDPRTTNRYARVADKAADNPAAAVPIRI
jgi:hypothetical protein